jgi:hypothetical protein
MLRQIKSLSRKRSNAGSLSGLPTIGLAMASAGRDHTRKAGQSTGFLCFMKAPKSSPLFQNQLIAKQKCIFSHFV